jgi:flagellin
MSLRVNTNVTAFDAYRNLTATDSAMSSSLQKLSSGSRINSASDDASGLVISQNIKAQIGGIGQAVSNAQDGISVVQTAEGALNEVASMLQRMRDLSVQAANSGANGGYSGTAVAAANAEVAQLQQAIDQISSTTQFNGTKLLDGTAGTLTFQVGANAGETLTIALKAMNSASLGTSSGTNVGAIDLTSSAAAASNAIKTLDAAISDVSTFRGTLGATENRLTHVVANLSVTQENLSASESRIADTDMASEMTNFSKQQILMQAGTSMLAQANSAPQAVLSLLRG